MLRFIFILGLLILLYFLVRKALRDFGRPYLGSADLDSRAHMIQDPVCRVYVPKGTAVAQSIGGQTYYFCSAQCAKAFQKQLSG